MKMITAIVNKKDAGEVCDALKDEKFAFTKMATTGGFLKAGNVNYTLYPVLSEGANPVEFYVKRGVGK